MTDNLPAGVVDIGGKPYKTVAKRVIEFRAKHTLAGGWGIVTEIIHIDNDVVRVKAKVTGPNNDVIGMGHAEEVRATGPVNKTSALENAETGAIGRALAACGFGGSDMEYASADEMVRAKQRENVMTEGKLSPMKHRAAHEAILDAVRMEDGPLLLEFWNELTHDQQGWIWQSFQSWERAAIKKLLATARVGPEVEPDISGAGS